MPTLPPSEKAFAETALTSFSSMSSWVVTPLTMAQVWTFYSLLALLASFVAFLIGFLFGFLVFAKQETAH